MASLKEKILYVVTLFKKDFLDGKKVLQNQSLLDRAGRVYLKFPSKGMLKHKKICSIYIVIDHIQYFVGVLMTIKRT